MQAGAILALIGGVGAALGHAPFHLWMLAIPGLILAIHAVASAPAPRAAFWRAWLAGAAYFGVALHWIVEPFLVDIATHGWMAPFALILLAGGLALFWGAAAALAARLGTTRTSRALAFAVLLSAAEMLRGYIFTGFPWAMPGYVWVETPVRMVAALAGSYGLTALTLIASALVAAAPGAWVAPLAGLAIFAALWGTGAWVEGGHDRGASLGTVGLAALTAELAAASPDLIVLPEVAVVYPLDAATGTLTALSGAAGDATLVTGINRRDAGNWYNSLVALAPGAVVTDSYDKVHLVPFGEYIPFRLGILRAMAATTSNGFSAGAAVRTIATPLPAFDDQRRLVRRFRRPLPAPRPGALPRHRTGAFRRPRGQRRRLDRHRPPRRRGRSAWTGNLRRPCVRRRSRSGDTIFANRTRSPAGLSFADDRRTDRGENAQRHCKAAGFGLTAIDRRNGYLARRLV